MKRRVVTVIIVLLAICCLSMTASAAPADDNVGLMSGFLQLLKDLFIPNEEYFQEFREDIAARFDAKFSGVSASIKYLDERFSQLRGYTGLNEVFRVTFPQGSFLNGISVNFLSTAKPVIDFIRFCCTGMVSLLTAIYCYKSIVRLINR